MVFINDTSTENVQAFLNITSIVEQDPGYTEEGLLGLAFHPNFSENGYFYVNYTDYGPKRNVIARYSVSSSDPNQADTESSLIILEVNQPYTNHNGGQMGFGPDDGYLYISFGDGGSAGDPQANGQNLQTLLGTIVRIDVDNVANGQNYSIPSDNPFLTPLAARDEIYAYGLRNMWRFSWDSETGLLWGADVGQDNWEEIDIIYPGHNYGWSTMEGNHCYPAGTSCNSDGFEPPVFEYALQEHNHHEHHVDGVCSVTGGYVYRGNDILSLYGKYIYGDWCTGDIWALTYSDDRNHVNEHIIQSELNITSFGLDQHNELLICANNKIYKLTSDEVLSNEENLSILPVYYYLERPYPSPFNPVTNIQYSLPVNTDVELVVYDIAGRKIQTLISDFQITGYYSITWNASQHPSGMYFVKMVAGEYVSTQKLMLVK